MAVVPEWAVIVLGATVIALLLLAAALVFVAVHAVTESKSDQERWLRHTETIAAMVADSRVATKYPIESVLKPPVLDTKLELLDPDAEGSPLLSEDEREAALAEREMFNAGLDPENEEDRMSYMDSLVLHGA